MAIPAMIGMGGKMLLDAMKPPKVEAPKVAPVADDKTRRIAQERKAQRTYAGMGREGTALSESSTLG